MRNWRLDKHTVYHLENQRSKINRRTTPMAREPARLLRLPRNSTNRYATATRVKDIYRSARRHTINYVANLAYITPSPRWEHLPTTTRNTATYTTKVSTDDYSHFLDQASRRLSASRTSSNIRFRRTILDPWTWLSDRTWLVDWAWMNRWHLRHNGA